MRLRDGSRLSAANYIVAVPPQQFLKLLPEAAVADPFFSRIGALKSSPIICVHVWLDREVTDSAFIGFIGTQTQWLFNKRRIFEQHGERHPGYLSFVISGARELVDRSNDELLDIVIDDLHAMIPAAPQRQSGQSAGAQRKACDDRARSTVRSEPPGDRYADSESLPRWRLDPDRPARHDRERGGFRPRCRQRDRSARR